MFSVARYEGRPEAVKKAERKCGHGAVITSSLRNLLSARGYDSGAPREMDIFITTRLITLAHVASLKTSIGDKKNAV